MYKIDLCIEQNLGKNISKILWMVYRHSNIELYTLDGKKITTPLDLTNDAAYVAVKPPDAFIQTGYEKYLLRASR